MLTGNPQLVYGATSSEPTVYYYQNPRTGERIASLLPPDHPQMVCLQTGAHVPETRYGCLGTFIVLLVDYCGSCWICYQVCSRRLFGSRLVSAFVSLIAAFDANAVASRLKMASAAELHAQTTITCTATTFFSSSCSGRLCASVHVLL